METAQLLQWLKETIDYKEDTIPEESVAYFRALKERLEKAEERERRERSELAFIKAAANAMPNPIFLKDQDLRYLFFNQAYKDFFGITDEQYIGKTVRDLPYLSVEEQVKYHNEDCAVMDRLTSIKYETNFQSADGMKQESMYWTKGFYVEETDVRGLVGEIVDISREKETQRELARSLQDIREKTQALHDQKQLFNILVNGTVDIFVMFSAKDYRVEYVSPNIRDLLGVTAEEVKKDIRHISATALDLNQNLLAAQLAAIPVGGSFQILNEHIHQRTGERHWYQKTVYHFHIDEEDKFVLVMSERTPEMKALKQLEIAMEMAKTANEAKSNFLANMSHDIRTPMNAIIGFSNLLKNDAENPEKVRDYARKITSSGQHLLSLINDVLDMSKIESGKTTLNITEFHLSELLEDIGVVVNPQAKAKKQSFEVLAHGLDVDCVAGDRTRINQILLNLLSNSVKYTGEGGKIELVIFQNKQSDGRLVHLIFQVIDNGMGMSQEYLEVIFDAFTREQNFTISGIQGTGLGMAITKNLVDLMGGTISVESKKDEGSTFTVALTLQNAEKDCDTDFWENNHVTRLLVVDDEEEICLDIQAAMSRTGIEIAYATDGKQAISMLKEAKEKGAAIDVVLLDRKMPEMAGLEVAERIREELAGNTGDIGDMPVVVLSAYDWSDIEEEAGRAGIHAFLPKPFFVTNFRKVIQHLNRDELRRWEQTQPETEPFAGLRFLVAEDNELNAEILTELLDMEGAVCDVAENGEIAVRKLQESERGYYDLILMDIQMPVMDGYAASRSIRVCGHPDARTIPIAAMTANAFDEDVHKALDSGMNAHVAKPVDMTVLKETILKLLQSNQK